MKTKPPTKVMIVTMATAHQMVCVFLLLERKKPSIQELRKASGRGCGKGRRDPGVYQRCARAHNRRAAAGDVTDLVSGKRKGVLQR
jgi:hypothetical protein